MIIDISSQSEKGKTMEVGRVSFGNVIAVSGRANCVKQLDNLVRSQQLFKNGQIMQQDVTSHYKYAPKTGLMAQSAQRGEPVFIYITGEDLKKFKKKNTLDVLLSNLSGFVSLYRIKPEDAVQKIVKS